MHYQDQAIWMMFDQATPTKSGTWSSTNSHILTDDLRSSDWTVYLSLSNARNDLLTSSSTYASTFHLLWWLFFAKVCKKSMLSYKTALVVTNNSRTYECSTKFSSYVTTDKVFQISLRGRGYSSQWQGWEILLGEICHK